jgi:acetyl-CoA carboxylase carboxyl transferase subunit alpha
MATEGNRLNNGSYLDFEQKVAHLELQIDELRAISARKGIDYSTEIRRIEKDRITELKRIYSSLTAWQTVQVARHPQRPLLTDYLSLMVKDFRELHGDRCFGDDRAIITGIGGSPATGAYRRQNKGRPSRRR